MGTVASAAEQPGEACREVAPNFAGCTKPVQGRTAGQRDTRAAAIQGHLWGERQLRSIPSPLHPTMSLAVKEKNHVRLVFLGAAGVGKTALIRRFLMDTFEPKHRRTVEELHSKEYEVSGATVKVEILDTSGSYSFPAMRKLSIQNSDAFALVYAVDDAESFESVKSLREEILEVKEDKFPPIVVVGNKAESGSERQVPAEDALSLVELDWNSRFVETSAKDNENVLEVFRELLQQANLPSRVSPALCKRRETLPKEQALRPPMNKTNSCSVC